MHRIGLLLNTLDKTFDKESWYAPFKHAITGLTADQARWKPAGEGTKSIWENVNHLLYYKERLVVNLDGREWKQHLDGNETFYLTEQSNDDRKWEAVVKRAEKVQDNLRHVLSKLSDDELNQHSLDEKLLDIMLHDAYHTGQIIQIRKMQGSWPSNR